MNKEQEEEPSDIPDNCPPSGRLGLAIGNAVGVVVVPLAIFWMGVALGIGRRLLPKDDE